MNCLTCQKLLLRDAGQAGSPAERAAVEAHLAECPSCRQLQTELDRMGTLIRSESAAVPPPDPAAEWRTLQSKLHAPRRRAAPVLWWSVPLAAAAAGALAFILPFSAPRQATPANGHANAPFVAQAEFVEPGDANASTMVYVDKQSGWLVVWATDAAPASAKSG